MSKLRSLWRLLTAASTIQWILSLAGSAFVSGVLGWLTAIPNPWAFFIWGGLFLMLLVLLLPFTARPAAHLAPRRSAVGFDFLPAHRLSALRAELGTLHHLFLQARAAKDDSALSGVEQVYQIQVEHSIKRELAATGDLLTRFWDDTGDPQPSSDERREQVVTFLQRRHARLREIIDDLQAQIGRSP